MEKKVKILSHYLLVELNESQRKKEVNNVDLCVVWECLKYHVTKLGSVIPLEISREILRLSPLLESRNSHIRIHRDKLAAVQTLLLNVSQQNRSLFTKILTFINMIARQTHVKTTAMELSTILAMFLFEERNNVDHLNVCSDLVLLSTRIVESPWRLMEAMRNKINNRFNDYNPFQDDNYVNNNNRKTNPSSGSIEHCSTKFNSPNINNFFRHSKIVPQSKKSDGILSETDNRVLTKNVDSSRKYEAKNNDNVVKNVKKRNSLIDLTKKVRNCAMWSTDSQ